jgi:hypothetical protein
MYAVVMFRLQPLLALVFLIFFLKLAIGSLLRHGACPVPQRVRPVFAVFVLFHFLPGPLADCV